MVVIAVGLALTFAGAALGASTSIELDGPTTITHGSGRYSYDEEVESLQIVFGYATLGFSLIVGIWAGMTASLGRWSAGFTEKGWLSFFAWLMALAILMVVSVLTHLAFKAFSGSIASYARMLVELGAMVGVGWACHQWWKNGVAQIPTINGSNHPAADAPQAARR